MALRTRLGVGGLFLVGGVALAISLVAKPFVPAVLASDTDGDGLSDAFETQYGTLTNDATTDGDMWNDWYEIFVSGTDPNDADTDGDGTDDDLDTAPLDDSTVGGNPDGRTTPTSTWAQNLTAAHFNGGSAVEGRGVQMHSGEFVHSVTFLTIDAGYGPDIVVGGTYRSGISYDGIYGQNWVFSFGERVVELGNGNVEYYPAGDFLSRTRDKGPGPYGEVPPDRRTPDDGDTDSDTPDGGSTAGGSPGGGSGGRITFVDPGGSTPITFTNPTEAVGLTLVKLVDDTFTLTDDNGNETAFRTDGRISSQKDRFGNTVSYSYNPLTGELVTITDATGHSVTITYWANTGRVKDITDGNSRKVEFTYNYFGQLAKWRTPTSTEYSGGRYFQYRYSNGSGTGTLNDNMIRALDPKGQEWLKNEFDSSDRTVVQYVGQDDLTFAYATGPTVTTVYDREGNQREWAITGTLPTSLKEYSNRNVRASDPTYWQTSFGHSSAGLRSKTVLPRGNRIDRDYDSAGRVTEIRRKTTDTDTDNNTNDIVESFTYDSAYGLLTSHTDALGNVTSFTLEDSGGLEDKVVETITHPTVTYLTPDQTATDSLTWNSQGQLLTRTDGEGRVTTCEYVGGSSVKKGYLLRLIRDSTSLDLTTEFDHTDWGTLKEITNPRGFTTVYTVNQYDWVTATVTDSPQSYETSYTHDANGMVTQRDVENVDKTNTRDTGNPWWTTTYAYDMLNQIVSETEEVTASTTRTWEYEYTKNGLLKTLTKPEGNEERLDYDERDLVYQRTRGYGTGDASTETSAYDENRNLTSWKNGRNKEWVHVFDLFDRRTRTTNPATHYTEWIYDKGSNVTERKRWEEAGATDVLRAHTKHSYDEMDRRFMTERGLAGSPWTWVTMTRVFDERSLVVEMEDACGNSTFFTYDGARRKTRTEDALGNKVDLTYDENGNVTMVEEIEVTGHSSAKTFVTEFQYDELDRREQEDVVDETNGSNLHTTTWKYDSLHVRVEQVDPENNTITWTHDGLGRVLTRSKAIAGGGSIVTTWGFDDNSRRVSHKDDGNNETTWDYNARDLVATETFADTETKTYEYDLADNVTEWVDPNGTDVDLTYDDNNRNTARTITRGSGVGGTTSEDYVYDALDRLTEAKDNDVTVQFTWDTLGRRLTETSGPNPISSYGKTTSYTYDPCGQVTGISYPDGSFSVTRTIDDLHRTTLVEDGSGNDIVAASYFGSGRRLKQLAFENQTTSDHGYDGFRWLSDLDHKTSTPTTFAGYDMAYDKVGNMVYEEWSHDSGKGNNYSYDKAYRLKIALMGTNDPSNEYANPGLEAYVKKLQYNLSDDSDRTSVVTTPYMQSPTTVSYTSNAVHEYTVVGGVNRTYDDNGNLVADGTYEYEYDYRNQLIAVSDGVATIAEYEHDPLGRRTRKSLQGGVSVRYYHAGAHEIEEYNGSGNILRKYVFGDTIDSIAMMEAEDVADVDGDLNTSELKRFYYHYDGRTNVARLTDPDEAVVESYETDSYGQVSIRDKNGSSVATTQIGNPFTFQRRRLDGETGLMYFRARMYDTTRGRWLQRDPRGLEPGPNWTEFNSSDPINRVDPFGTDDKRFESAAAVAQAAAAGLEGLERLGGAMGSANAGGYVSSGVVTGGSSMTDYSWWKIGRSYLTIGTSYWGSSWWVIVFDSTIYPTNVVICPCAGPDSLFWQYFYDAVHEMQHREYPRYDGNVHSETVEALQDMAHNMEADTDTDTTAECKCGCQFLVTEEEMVAGMKAQASANEGRGER